MIVMLLAEAGLMGIIGFIISIVTSKFAAIQPANIKFFKVLHS